MAKASRQAAPPDGFRYQPDAVSPGEAHAVSARIAQLPLREFEFHGYVGRRRVISYGWRYDFGQGTLAPADPVPSFLAGLRERAAAFAELASHELSQALITEYRPGAGIGWHRDKGVFADVVGVSLLSGCLFRFRRRAGATWERFSFLAEPDSMYLLRGPARTEWEHSIPAVEALRYSVTFRSLRARR